MQTEFYFFLSLFFSAHIFVSVIASPLLEELQMGALSCGIKNQYGNLRVMSVT